MKNESEFLLIFNKFKAHIFTKKLCKGIRFLWENNIQNKIFYGEVNG